jgi:phosphoribosyl-dephospho-CoA transferase
MVTWEIMGAVKSEDIQTVMTKAIKSMYILLKRNKKLRAESREALWGREKYFFPSLRRSLVQLVKDKLS